MPIGAMSFCVAASQTASSPAQWVLIVAIILLSVCCVLVFVGGLGFGCLGTVTAALFFPISRFVATSLGASGLTAGLIGALIAEIAFLVSCGSVAAVLDHREQRERRAELAYWETWRKRPRGMGEMREYWNSGE
ncbi:hypothetical protein ACFV2X_40145 [Streptomyces sp. NPDC059679]|uniref:hypothetical protein n=1 Tax=Streptomyces sp. NPDC059679 TaxID=3346903 RepID=UPI0036984D1F